MRSKIQTIGSEIDRLVKKHGNTTFGIYVIEQALLRSLGASDYDLIKIGGDNKLIHQFDRYKELNEKEKRILAKYTV